jgi:hypothetical protein
MFEFYWTSFVNRWHDELGLPADVTPYRYYDIDTMVVVPNQDYRIGPFEVLKDTDEEIVVHTGFGSIVRRVYGYPMIDPIGSELDTIEKVRALQFDDPGDERRFFQRGDDHLNGVGGDSEIVRDVAPFVDRVKEWAPDFFLLGHVEEASEYMINALGLERMLLWIGMHPDDIGRFAERINAFSVEMVKAQVKAAGGMLDGICIGGDFAYTKNMFFSPRYWRKHFKPGVKAIIETAHDLGLPVIYHGCGNVKAVLEDFADIGLDGYNPLEAKAGQDVIDLRRQLGHGLAFVGNNDVRVWERGDREEIKTQTLRKLNAGKGGGYLFGSDHSVTGDVSGEVYDYIVNLVRECGRYPLRLGEYDIPDLS